RRLLGGRPARGGRAPRLRSARRPAAVLVEEARAALPPEAAREEDLVIRGGLRIGCVLRPAVQGGLFDELFGRWHLRFPPAARLPIVREAARRAPAVLGCRHLPAVEVKVARFELSGGGPWALRVLLKCALVACRADVDDEALARFLDDGLVP